VSRKQGNFTASRLTESCEWRAPAARTKRKPASVLRRAGEFGSHGELEHPPRRDDQHLRTYREPRQFVSCKRRRQPVLLEEALDSVLNLRWHPVLSFRDTEHRQCRHAVKGKSARNKDVTYLMMALNKASPTGCYELDVRFESHSCSGQMRFRRCDNPTDVWLGELPAFLNE
jgi:hypothetical protein